MSLEANPGRSRLSAWFCVEAQCNEPLAARDKVTVSFPTDIRSWTRVDGRVFSAITRTGDSEACRSVFRTDGRLKGAACFEDIDFRAARGLDKQIVRSLIQDSAWVQRHQHIFLVGPTGIGKTFLARAFGQKACRDGFTAYFATAAQLFREIELARADGSYTKKPLEQ